MGGIARLIEYARNTGLKLEPRGDRLRVVGPKSAQPLALELLKHKAEVLAHLRRTYPLPLEQEPGRCETCKAAGWWDLGEGRTKYCFAEAVFYGRSAKALPAEKRRENCPLKNHQPLAWEWWERMRHGL